LFDKFCGKQANVFEMFDQFLIYLEREANFNKLEVVQYFITDYTSFLKCFCTSEKFCLKKKKNNNNNKKS